MTEVHSLAAENDSFMNGSHEWFNSIFHEWFTWVSNGLNSENDSFRTTWFLSIIASLICISNLFIYLKKLYANLKILYLILL